MFRKAEKYKIKLRLGVYGQAGSGKIKTFELCKIAIKNFGE